MLAIADAVGGEWPGLARAAALRLSRVDDDETFAIVLLKDMQAMFEIGSDELSSFELAENLGAMEDRPWPEFKHGKPITPQNIACLSRSRCFRAS